MKVARLIGILLTVVATQASAEVTYNYTGNDFTGYFVGNNSTGFVLDGGSFDPTLGLRVTGSVVFDDTVVPDFTGDAGGHILSFAISSGPITYISGDNTFKVTTFQFDGGHIVDWQFGALSPNGGVSIFSMALPGIAFMDMAQNLEGGSEEGGQFIGGNAVFDIPPGIWTRVAAPVPLPGASWLLAPAIAGLGLARRRQA